MQEVAVVMQKALCSSWINNQIGSLKEKIRYGKVLWELVCVASVIILPVLAVASPGIRVLAHKFGVQSNQIALLSARLAANNMRMYLCQALSPIAVELDRKSVV